MLMYSGDIGHRYTCICLHVAVGVYTYYTYIYQVTYIYKRNDVNAHILYV